MKTNVIDIQINESLREAVKKMLDNGIHKILVKDGDKTKGILELSKIQTSNLDKQCKDVPLCSVGEVQNGTPISQTYDLLKTHPAVLVKTGTNISGIVSYSDFIRESGLRV